MTSLLHQAGNGHNSIPFPAGVNITAYANPAFGSIRVVTGFNNELWFVAKDVCDALELGNHRSSLALLDEDERGVHTVDTLGGIQEMLIVSEPGLYSLVLRSRKPEARAFKRWITHEVIPSIRKHGAYATPSTVEAMLADPDTAITLLQNLKIERERRAALEHQYAIDRPKVIFADAVDAAETSILIGDFAKILHQNGIDIGQKRLFEWLRQSGYLMKHGDSRNMPTQRSMELKLFEIKERTIDNPDGSIRITKTPKITGKGQIYFVNLFKSSSTVMRRPLTRPLTVDDMRAMREDFEAMNAPAAKQSKKTLWQDKSN